jgi:hypothetical protein
MFHSAISVPEGSENVAEKKFFGNAKQGAASDTES